MTLKPIALVAICLLSTILSAAENLVDMNQAPQKIAKLYVKQSQISDKVDFEFDQNTRQNYQPYSFENLPKTENTAELRRFIFQAPFKITNNHPRGPGLLIGPSNSGCPATPQYIK